MEKILKKLRLARNEKGYSQEYMAGKLGISQKAYSKLEKSQTKLTVSRLNEIAGILELDLNLLMD